MIVHQDERIGGVRDHRLKDFSRVAERLIYTALADRTDLNEVLLGVKKRDPQDFAIQKAHLAAEIGD